MHSSISSVLYSPLANNPCLLSARSGAVWLFLEVHVDDRPRFRLDVEQCHRSVGTLRVHQPTVAHLPDLAGQRETLCGNQLAHLVQQVGVDLALLCGVLRVEVFVPGAAGRTLLGHNRSGREQYESRNSDDVAYSLRMHLPPPPHRDSPTASDAALTCNLHQTEAGAAYTVSVEEQYAPRYSLSAKMRGERDQG